VFGRRHRLPALALAGVLAATAPVDAHPHIFVDHSVLVRFGAAGPETVEFSWTFDDMFSTLVLQSFDADKDRAFSPAEIQTIEQKHFGNLKEYQYFVVIRQAGKSLPVTVRQFRATASRGLVTYAFTVPVSGAAASEGTLEILVDDPTFYTAFTPAAGTAIQAHAPAGFKVKCEVARDTRGFEPDAFRCVYRKATR
jgi:ABC-type uncharacterized transport system substrate-binding protein